MLRSLFKAQRTLPVRQMVASPARGRFYSGTVKPEAAAEGSEEATSHSEPAPESSQSPELTALEEKFLAKDKECAKFKDAYQRSVAEFRNLQKTTDVEKKKAKDFALQGFAKDLLSTVDNFDLALKAVDAKALESAELKNFYDGVKMVQDVFEKTLDRNGLVKINPLDEKFDPKIHEAVFMAPIPDKENGIIFDVQQTGFVYHDRVIRAPKVGVVKK